MNQKDRDRCDNDFLRCLGKVAVNLIKNTDRPYTISDTEIERNGTTRKKTLRLLSEAGRIIWHNRYYRRHSSEKFNFRKQFDTQAKELEQKPEFFSTPTEIKTAWESTSDYSNIKTSQEAVNQIGYRCIETLKPAEQIYVWFHLDDFIVTRTEKSSYMRDRLKVSVFPRELLNYQKIQAMRGIFKKYAEPLLMPWLSDKFDIDLCGFDNHTKHLDKIEKDDYFNDNEPRLALRNFMRFPAAFNDLAFKGPKGYAIEYQERLDWLRHKTQTMRNLVANVKAYGYEKLMREFTEHAKEYLVSEAPLKLIEKDEAGAGALILSDINMITFENMFERSNDETRQSPAA